MATDTINKVRIDVSVELSREYCSTCGVQFAIPTTMRDRALENHSVWFWCPNGHSLHFLGKTEAEKLRDELDRARAYHADTREALAEERKHHASTKGKLTKTINRARAGVCPFCTRTFTNVQRHIDGQHPAAPAR